VELDPHALNHVLGEDKSRHDGKKRIHDIRRLENRRKRNAREVGAVRLQQTCDCVSR
jgi:hypothetical protein